MRIELSVHISQNEEPYVDMTFGPGVPDRDRDQALSLAYGPGLSCGYGPGRRVEAERAAKSLARRLRRLGWSVVLA